MFKLLHDCDAHRDPKMRTLLRKYGAEGYGWFWLSGESQLEQGGRWDKSEPGFWGNRADELRTSEETAKAFIDDCIQNLKLFAEDDNFIWSPRLLKDLNEFLGKCDRASFAGKRGAAARYEKVAQTEAEFAPLVERYGLDCIKHYRLVVMANHEKRGIKHASLVAAVEEWLLKDREDGKGWFQGQHRAQPKLYVPPEEPKDAVSPERAKEFFAQLHKIGGSR